MKNQYIKSKKLRNSDEFDYYDSKSVDRLQEDRWSNDESVFGKQI